MIAPAHKSLDADERVGWLERARAAQLLERRFGLSPTAFPSDAMRRGLLEAARAANLTVEALLDAGERDESDGVLQPLVERVINGETYLFRHPEHFALLKQVIVPERLRAGRTTLAAWSAGCSTGEEAYSLAAAIGEAAPNALVRVLGSDLSERALLSAKKGEFAHWAVRAPLPPGVEIEELDGGRAVVRGRLNERVRFQRVNLHRFVPSAVAHLVEMSGFDVIFCRNVLVYLQTEAARAVVARIADALLDGGWLVLSAIDPELAPASLERVVIDGLTLLRKPTQEPIRPPALARKHPTQTSEAPPRPSWHSVREAMARAREAADRGELERAVALAREAVSVERTPEALHLLALVLVERGEPADEAIRLLEEAVHRAPEYVVGWLGLGLSERVDPAHRRAHLARALALVERRRDEEILPGPEPLSVAWVRRLARAGLSQ